MADLSKAQVALLASAHSFTSKTNGAPDASKVLERANTFLQWLDKADDRFRGQA